MSKIIEHPDRLIESFAAAFGEHNRDIIERCFSRYISDAVIAVTAEDIAAHTIAWASSHNEFHYEPIDINVDGDRYVAIQNILIQALDVEALIQHIEDEWDMNSSLYDSVIDDALFSRYDEEVLLDIFASAVDQYNSSLE